MKERRVSLFSSPSSRAQSEPDLNLSQAQVLKISSLALKSNFAFVNIQASLTYFVGLCNTSFVEPENGLTELLIVLAWSLTYKVPTKILARAFEPKLRLIPYLLRALFLAFGDRKSLIRGAGFWKVFWAFKAHLYFKKERYLSHHKFPW